VQRRRCDGGPAAGDSSGKADNVRLDPKGKLAYVGYGDGALPVIGPQQK
jgi:hypothetical protein